MLIQSQTVFCARGFIIRLGGVVARSDKTYNIRFRWKSTD